MIHRLRKSKATHDMADGVPIPYIESRGSWTKGSRALQSCYLSVLQKDKDNAYRAKYGMQTRSAETVPTPFRRCVRCESLIEEGTRFCARCGMPADNRVAAEVQQIEIAKLIDPNVLSELVKRYVEEEMRKAPR